MGDVVDLVEFKEQREREEWFMCHAFYTMRPGQEINDRLDEIHTYLTALQREEPTSA